MNATIDIREVEFAASSIIDEVGRVFYWRGGVYRAVRREYAESMRDMFTGGMIAELMAERLVPRSRISDYEMQEFGLILEHERLEHVTYPHEWTLSMLRDAALTVLKVNRIALKYCYQTKDAHPFNIIFDATTPFFIDFGSFVKVPEGYGGFLAYEEFCRCYYYPLKLWQIGDAYSAHGVLCLERNEYLPHESYLLYKYSCCRWLNPEFLQRIVRLYFRSRNLRLYTAAEIHEAAPRIPENVIRYLLRWKDLPLQKVSYAHLMEKIQRIRAKKTRRTRWGRYHDQYTEMKGDLKLTPRFQKIISIMQKFDIKSVIELGGNQGVFSRLVQRNTDIKRVICTDSDSCALERLYARLKESNEPVNIAVLDILYPVTNDYIQHPSIRLSSDAVVALALTHHLLLSQGQSIDRVMRILAMYTKKYVFVEFMPLGLYDGEHETEPLPKWYTLDCFRQAFQKYFYLQKEETLEINRILFVGRLLFREESGGHRS